MTTQWYYVQGSERIGPIEQQDLESLFHQGTLTEDSYVWRKGFDNWLHLKGVEELTYLRDSNNPTSQSNGNDFDEDVNEIPMMDEGEKEIQQISQIPVFDLHSIAPDTKVFTIKIGYDRGGQENEYGPFSINQLSRAFSEGRINEKTFIFTPGMSTWVLLGDFERFEEIAGGLPPQISELDQLTSAST